ncbi:MAG: hypothetical protein J2P37_31150, partial [Ktedonobacteraceae bacterium]|nr:hypothetical protein [Ktedonobacteraceae bacterium]
TAGVVTTDLQEHDRVLLTMLLQENDTLLLSWYGDNGEQATALKSSAIPALPRARKGPQLIQGRVNYVVKL